MEEGNEGQKDQRTLGGWVAGFPNPSVGPVRVQHCPQLNGTKMAALALLNMAGRRQMRKPIHLWHSPQELIPLHRIVRAKGMAPQRDQEIPSPGKGLQ